MCLYVDNKLDWQKLFSKKSVKLQELHESDMVHLLGTMFDFIGNLIA